ncbi:MAG: hypothetical protein QGF67_01915 [Lentisphaeria bacterium]|nr:hypothetical protein [Lentisphaeria bacterium]MDP7740169.1 hypothetical protein [Lentisphaeria bacterium]
MKRRHGIVLALLAIGLAPGVHGEWTQAELDAGCVVFQYSPMKNLSPAFVPSREIVAEKLSCVLARNEYESIQFGVHALTDDIEAIEVAVESDLDVTIYHRIEPAIKEQLEAASPEAGEVRGWLLGEIHLQRGNVFKALEKERSVNFWLTFHADRQTPDGVHAGKIRIQAAGKPETVVDLEINVRSFELPRPRASFGMWFREDMLPKRLGGTAAPRETILAIYRDMVAHGQTACVFYPTANFHPLPPQNHHVINRLLPLAKKAGLFEEPHALSLLLGGIAGDDDQEQLEASIAWLKVQREKNGWPEFAGFASDEPHYPLEDAGVKRACAPLQGLAMRMSIDQSNIGAVYGYSVPNLCDIQSIGDGIITEEVMAEANRMGFEILTYSYTMWREGFNPLRQRYFAGLHTWALELRGNWMWAYHHIQHRHAWFAPRSHEPMPLTGWEARREGVDDFRYLQMLEDTLAGHPDTPLATEASTWLAKLRTRLRPIMPLTVTDGTPLALEEYDAIRNRAAAYLGKLTPAAPVKPQPIARVKDEAAPFREKSVDACIAGLRSDDMATRRAAAWALYERGAGAAAAVSALANVLNDADVRMPALHALEAIGPGAHEAAPMIAQQLEHPDFYVRMGALLTLGAIGCPLDKREPDGVRSPSANANAVIEPLAIALGDNFKDVSNRAAEMLGVMGALARPAVPTAVLLLNDPEKSKRAAAVKLISRLGPTAAAAVPRLTSQHEKNPGDASYIYALAAIGPAAAPAVPALEQYAGRDNPGARQADSYYALVCIRNDDTDLRNLVDLLEHPATNANTRNHVVECLERLGPKAAPLADEIRELTKAGEFTDAEKQSAFGKTPPAQAHYIDGADCLQLMHDLELAARLPLGGWRFKDDPQGIGVEQGWFKPDFPTADLPEIKIGAFWDDQGYKGLGEGWYNLQYTCPELPAGKRVFVLFEAVDEGAWLYIDGKLIAWYDTAYPDITWSKPFLLDVTGALDSRGEHRLTVKVDNYSGAGGLYKPISVMVEK